MYREPNTPAPTIYRKDYAPPAYWTDTVDLTFDLDPAKTRVLNKMQMRRNPDVAAQPLRLDGKELTLSRVLVNGQGTSFKMDGDTLVLENLPEGDAPFELEIFTTCAPNKNTALMGLYTSEDGFFTQCEAEGFRRITYFLDRPDVMATYKVTLRADKQKYPVLLSNGNLIEQGDWEDGRHFAVWHDPFKKPSYLFALVAGLLVAREQTITSRAGKKHLLQVFVRPGDLDKTEHAMRALQASIAWDEARFGLPLDLERFMIVATGDFNMGAMENKGLNIFNSKYVLASPATATDTDYFHIESIVAHEYFHNWTGNRITCRDWFQLSLKEGLTVFRDQEFSEDMAGSASARAVCRISNVRDLRSVQFSEDAGPMAHPVRPDQFQEISNFYTATVYEKGAEVVRMYQTLVGREGFRRGMDLYFERHDGQAVSCDDFAQCMADANPGSQLASVLPQFKRWYSQAGTPRVQAAGTYNAAAQTYTLDLAQSCPATPGQAEKDPFVIPIAVALLSADGHELPGTARLHVMTQAQETVVFEGIAAEPVPSLLRGFSAPVNLDFAYTDSQFHTLLAHDTDPFNRWEAAQRLMMQGLLRAIESQDAIPADLLDAKAVDALRTVLRDPQLDAGFKNLVLHVPLAEYVADQLQVVDPQRIDAARQAMAKQLALALHSDWQWASTHYTHSGAYTTDAASTGRRALLGKAQAMLCLAAAAQNDQVVPGQTYQRFKDANNMTERLNALQALLHSGHPLASDALDKLYAQFRHDPLVIDKWFALQAMAPDNGGLALARIKQLMAHADFSIKNPNRARSVIFSFCNGNLAGFHRQDAAGYVFWAEQVLALDALNPQVAARLARSLDRWKRLAEPYRSAAQEAIRRVAGKADLSADVREVVEKALAG